MSTCPLVHAEPAESVIGRLCRWHASRARKAVESIPAAYYSLAARLGGRKRSCQRYHGDGCQCWKESDAEILPIRRQRG